MKPGDKLILTWDEDPVPVTIIELLSDARARVSFDRTKNGVLIVPLRMLRKREDHER